MRSCISIIIPLALAASAAAQTAFVAEPASRLWIAGRSNISAFECTADDYEIRARTQRSDALPATAREATFTAAFRVAGLSCGRSRMDRDLRTALRADRFPEIRFTFDDATVESAPVDPGAAYGLKVAGALTIAGVTRPIECAVEGFALADGRLRARGNAAIRLTDYGIDPPRRLFGLVRVMDQLAVHFDLALKPAH